MVRIPSGAQLVLNERFVTRESCNELLQQLHAFLAEMPRRTVAEVQQEGGLHHRKVIRFE